jgi:hypothetical protein
MTTKVMVYWKVKIGEKWYYGFEGYKNRFSPSLGTANLVPLAHGDEIQTKITVLWNDAMPVRAESIPGGLEIEIQSS